MGIVLELYAITYYVLKNRMTVFRSHIFSTNGCINAYNKREILVEMDVRSLNMEMPKTRKFEHLLWNTGHW